MSSAFPPLPHHKTNIKMNTMNIHTNTQHQHLPCLTKHSHPISGFRSITWRPAYVSARPVRLTTPRFMSPKHDEQGSKEIKDVLDLFEHHAALDTLDTLQQRVTDSWGEYLHCVAALAVSSTPPGAAGSSCRWLAGHTPARVCGCIRDNSGTAEL